MQRINVTRSSMPSFDEFTEEIKDLWDSRWLTHMGIKHQNLQKELMKYLDVDGLELLVNCHMAMEVTLQAMNLKGEVITTPFTFASTTHAIVRSGLIPVFCDIEPQTYTIDVSKIENLITEKTCAIMPVHVYGNICDVEEIERIAQKHNLKVIYDAAHAFGIKYKGRGIGSFGDASCFSFHATKVFHTIEGGAVCFHDELLGKDIYSLRYYGQESAETITSVGTNAKMNEFCAAMGLCNLRHIDAEIEKRRAAAIRYRENFDAVQGIKLCPIQEDVHANNAYFPVVFEEESFGANRDYVLERLKEHHIFARKYFYPTTDSFGCYGGRFDIAEVPMAHEISNNILTLPMYPDLSLADVDKICKVVLECRK